MSQQPDPSQQAPAAGQASPDSGAQVIAESAPVAKPQPALWRRGPGLLPGLLALPVLAGTIGCALWWGVATQPGTNWLLQQVPGLQVSEPEGSLIGDFSAKRLSYVLPGSQDKLELEDLRWRGLSLRWNRSPRLWADLQIEHLQAQRLQLHLQPSQEPSSAPSDLNLPIGVQVARLQVAEMLLPSVSDKPLSALQASLQLGAKGGTEHQLKLDSLHWDLLQMSGTASIQAGGSMALQSSLELRSKADDAENLPAWQAQLQAKGPLQDLTLSAHLQAESQQLQAQAQVQPFAAWPLSHAKLDTHQLDLSALVSGLPRTSLNGQAELLAQPSSQTQPPGGASTSAGPSLVLKSQLSNSLAGRWNEQGLPIRSLNLDLAFAPGDPAALSIKQLELLLGSARQPAGRVHAKGQSSKDKGSALTVAIQDLDSEALDARAAALQLAGEIELSTRQPVNQIGTPGEAPAQLEIIAKLEGRLLNNGKLAGGKTPSPVSTGAAGTTHAPLSLRAQAQVSSTDLNLQSFKLRFEDAEVEASGQLKLKQAASMAQGWQAQAKVQAQAPDLRRFWRGEEGSSWRQTVQALSAQFEANLQAGPRPEGGKTQSPGLYAYAPSGSARLQVLPTQLAGVPFSADIGYTHLERHLPPQLKAELNAGANNRLQAQGELNQAGAMQAEAELQFAELASLQPLLTAFRAPAAAASNSVQTAKTSGTAPALRTTAPAKPAAPAQLLGSLQGKLKLQTTVAQAGPVKPGQMPAPWTWHSQAEMQARGLRLSGLPNRAALQLNAADLQWDLDSAQDAPLALSAKMEQLSGSGWTLPNASASLQGSWAKHRFELQALAEGKLPAALIAPGQATNKQGDVTLRGPLSMSMTGSLSAAPNQAWRDGAKWSASEIKLFAQPQTTPLPQGPNREPAKELIKGPWLKAQNLQLNLGLGPQARLQQLQLEPGRIELLGAGLSWQQAQWTAANPEARLAQPLEDAFNLDLRLEPLSVAPLLAHLQPDFGWSGDLVVVGHARVHSSPQFSVDMALERSAGDLIVSDDSGVQKLELSEMRLGVVGSPGVWHVTQALAGRNVGVLGAAATARNEDPTKWWPNAQSKLEGVLEARVANLSTWGAWVPTGWRMGGNVFANASFAGRLKAPEFKGRAGGSALVLRNPLLGVDLQRGEFALSLDGGQAKLEQFKAYAGEGELSAHGEVLFGAKPRVDLHLLADKFGVLRRVDQRLAVNGRVDLALDADLLDVQGQLDVHDGLFDFSRGNAPELGDDVTVHRPDAAANDAGAKAASTSKRRIKVKIDIDLGKKLRVKGYGLDTLLAGNLQLTQTASGPALHGRISTESGTFDAYGQKLEIEKGQISFNGVVDNPRLDVLALRPSQEDQRVGVSITGTAQKPRVKLYSEPALDERSTLSWLLLGRAPSELGSQDSALLSSAALALLNGQGESKTAKLIKSVGLDELSFSDSGVEAQGTVVRLGKQLSKRLYVGYERGLNATAGSWQLIYRLAQRFTLRAQSGDDNALDLIWQWKWE
ncbi:translocation/assembly module TamB domain-containing protein [Paucibacter sp. AS339]|uniref:translocation/assembly module TamB domain-containing protein n=1 Tax=Paucibacter hankyongi TaxID=3133434 RepID=UPI00309B6316